MASLASRRVLRWLASASVFAAVSGVAGGVAEAQTPPFARDIDLQLFRPAVGAGNFITVAGSRVAGNRTPSFGAWLQYGHRPFTIYDAACPNATDDADCAPGAVRARPVDSLTTLHLQAGIALSHRVLVSIDLPLSYVTGDAVDASTARPIVRDGQSQRVSSVGLGDPRLEARARLAGEGLQGPGLAVSAFANIPTGRFTGLGDRYAADSALSLGGRIIGDYRRNRFAAAVNVGGVWRAAASTVLSTTVGSRLAYGAAASFDFTPRITGIVEFWGSTAFGNAQDNAGEVDLAARYRVGDLAFTLGGGVGALRAAGVPTARAFLGFSYAPVRSDGDGDGVYDADDRCQGELEDLDGFEDDDGCADPDNDGDGIADTRDRCPDQAEDRDNFQDADGCPDPDNDNDGVPDGYDSCPREPEDRDGDHDEDGCPDNDRDRDGIPDDRDRCPGEQEDTDGFADEDGCPDPDNDNDGIPDAEDQCSEQPEDRDGDRDTDGCPDVDEDRDRDGIPDARDRCPEEPENFNGREDTDGCPEANVASLVEISGESIRILQQVNFANNSDRIVGRTSFDVLDAVAAVMNAHSEIQQVDVQGHTDDRGNAARNRSLSQRRADRVRSYLVDHGVAAARLTAHGFGPDQPIAPNTTSIGRATNRRVEFHIAGGGVIREVSRPASP
ncbi:MAG: OmpA family protein [Myxococcales bacterium]|nr:OmpA family protein [Myxococcales bacterium]